MYFIVVNKAFYFNEFLLTSRPQLDIECFLSTKRVKVFFKLILSRIKLSLADCGGEVWQGSSTVPPTTPDKDSSGTWRIICNIDNIYNISQDNANLTKIVL